MLRSLRVLLFALLAVAVAITSARAADMDSKAQALVKLDDEWSKTAATKDAHKVASFYAENALAYPPNDVLAHGRDAAEKVWAAYFGAAPDFKISWKTTHAEISKSGDLGYTTGTYQDSFTGADGKMVNEVGKYVCVWARQKDGSWKAIHDIWNADTK